MRHAICKYSELEEGRGKLFELEGHAIAVFRVGGEVRAIDNVCPHREGPLAFGDLKSGVLYCPLHAWPFDLATGRCLEFPGVGVRVFAVHVTGDTVEIEI